MRIRLFLPELLFLGLIAIMLFALLRPNCRIDREAIALYERDSSQRNAERLAGILTQSERFREYYLCAPDGLLDVDAVFHPPLARQFNGYEWRKRGDQLEYCRDLVLTPHTAVKGSAPMPLPEWMAGHETAPIRTGLP
jgi:hypothetical protein